MWTKDGLHNGGCSPAPAWTGRPPCLPHLPGNGHRGA
jgi:hypothetical protein